MTIFLPVAGLPMNLWLLVAAGGLAGFLSGLLGVGGGFILTPLLIMLGISPAVAAASDTNAIVGTSASGVLAHLRQGNVDFRMGLVLLAGGLLGGAGGTFWVRILRKSGNLDAVIVSLYVAFLGILGVVMFVEGLLSRIKDREEEKGSAPVPGFLDALPLQASFPGSGIRVSLLAPLVLGALVGLLAAFMGVGGGFFLVPAMTFLLRMPMRVVVGTSLFQILFTAFGVTFLQASVNRTVDVVVALCLMAGSTVGAQAGAALGRKLKGTELRLVFALLLLFLSLKMLDDLLSLPSSFLIQGGGHP